MSFQKTTDTERFPVNADTEAIDVIDVPVIDTWRAMEDLVKKGKVRSIGVSNFTKEKIQDLWDQAEIKPAVNQIEAHPYLQQPELLAWSKNKVQLYADDFITTKLMHHRELSLLLIALLRTTSTTCLGKHLHHHMVLARITNWCTSADDDDTIKELAEKLGKPPVSVLLSWAVQRGTVVLTKSVTPSRIKANLEGKI